MLSFKKTASLFIIQPPYSYEVNPTKYIWDKIKEKYLWNKNFTSIKETMNKVCESIKDLSSKHEYLKSMKQIKSYSNFIQKRILFQKKKI